ncbi:MAG: carbamoyltransferase HypF [Verrucomicrobiota bacterium]
MKPPSTERLKLAICGAVQGVGFRPFVHRLATELHVAGWVNNSSQGVLIEAEGLRFNLENFLRRLKSEKPPRCSIQSMESTWLSAAGYREFEIRESEARGRTIAFVPPDVATCPDCLWEMNDPANRRYRYPFTNCTNCGPRFSIVESLPYDRANTSMKKFTMCPQCQVEYDDPGDRRFHAQPNACPLCGPRLELWDSGGESVFGSEEALLSAAQAIRRGQIVAVKGIGGFHLMANACNEEAVRLLRARKHREEKPFAVMFPEIRGLRTVCDVLPLEEQMLLSPEAPIVLLKRIARHASPIAHSVAPGNPWLGVMMPSNPLHHLLLAELKFPVVATSGNVSDEPICTDECEALERLHGIADWFLVHDRPVVRHVDDSIMRLTLGSEAILRRARGFAPLPIPVKTPDPNAPDVLAVGAQLKNSIALAVGGNAFISQHIGDLETEPAHRAFRSVVADFEKLYDARPQIVIADSHPDYLSSKFARELPVHEHCEIQHHVAHVLSCIAENDTELPALGMAWDGTGFGADGTIWGGEFFRVAGREVTRVAHLRPFRLPGGTAAVREPRRAALGLLFEMYGAGIFRRMDLMPVLVFSDAELALLQIMLKRKLNSPPTTSIGRLFDAVASLLNVRQKTEFEGQAAMELEFLHGDGGLSGFYPLPLVPNQGCLVLDWQPMMEQIMADIYLQISPGEISTKFHNALVEAAVAVAKHIGEPRVAISGGCFQNHYLLERMVNRLRQEKFQPAWHQRVPSNDGGIALGQISAARHQIKLK